MPSYDKTSLWQKSLAGRIDDPHHPERERLRTAFERFRERARPIAEGIARDLPDFTIHDITHSDALWEYADLIAGHGYEVNPCETFVLGGVFLIHDLGMGLAAYPDGLRGLKTLPVWKDAIAGLLRRAGVEDVTEERIRNAGTEIEKKAVEDVLRRLHADRAEKLALAHWDDTSRDQRFYLLEDSELRDAFGPLIGRIAHSHWWPIDQVAKEFASAVGAPGGFPQEWTVDPLKLACLLRAADYCHLDERRAPLFVRLLRKPPEASDSHWIFQSKLYQPRLEADRLIYTAKSAFSITETAAWWLCFDTLRAIDGELRRIDSLFADTKRGRLAARGVSQADEPSRLAKLIRTDGWQPVDTRIRVSAVADLVTNLGGRELYGNKADPPLRELIQNAADAVRARRTIDGKDLGWGEVRVITGKDDVGVWIQVEDSGIGMSEAVLTGPLLDFGTTFWGSDLMHEEFPGLDAKGYRPIGKYGIGFFSVFMWGDRVRVTTQRFDRARSDTLVLDFSKGLKERPLLRKATPAEYVSEGGTRVTVWLRDEKILERLKEGFEEEKLTFAEACARIAPCLDVTLYVLDESGEHKTAVAANDWLTIDDQTLRKRIAPVQRPLHRRKSKDEDAQTKFFPALRIINDDTGRPLGRAAIWSWHGYYFAGLPGIVTVGGLRACGLAGIIGVLVGSPERAARDSAIPTVPIRVFRKWAEDERDARLTESHSPEILERIAQVCRSIGIELGDLPIARTDTGWVNADQIRTLARELNEALLVQDAAVDMAGGKVAQAHLRKGVFAVDVGVMDIVHSDTRSGWVGWPPHEHGDEWGSQWFHEWGLMGAVIESLAKGWGCSIKDVLATFESGDDDEGEEREIGTVAEKPLFEDAYRICRPK